MARGQFLEEYKGNEGGIMPINIVVEVGGERPPGHGGGVGGEDVVGHLEPGQTGLLIMVSQCGLD